ncbi:MAG TPA: beta-ketoacyl-ACP synthase III [Bacillota bacterium]|nr:beta-ketoacyl-ACP synthase III [Bacillota bacterium]
MSITVGITSIGSYVPEKRLTNADLEKMVETNDEWITTRTGIKERRIAGDELNASDLAVEAARNCLTGVEVKPDFLISSCGTSERKFPYQASIVANRLQLTGLAAFDLNAGCSGLIFSMATGYSLMQTGIYHNVLVTAAEKMTDYVDYSDRSSCILFGDGASAVLLSTEQPEHNIVTFELGTDATGYDQVILGGKGPDFYFRQDGRNVFKFAVNKVEELVTVFKERIGFKDSNRLHIIPHQANLRIIQAAADKLKIAQDKFICNIHKYGNTSSASIGLALDEACREGRFQKGDFIFMIGFGAGLSWAGAVIEW